MTNTRIVITSISTISPLGVGFNTIENSSPDSAKVSTVKEYEMHELDDAVSVLEIKDYDPIEVLGKKGLRNKDWTTKVLLGAIELTNLSSFEHKDPTERPGICVGTAFGSVQSIGDFLSDSIVNGVNAVNPQKFANTVINSPTGNANIRNEIRSLSTTTATGFNAGIDALIYSCNQIKQGYFENILAGGVEELSYYAILGMLRSGVISASGIAKPFSSDADGFVPAEGCAMFMLETEESAKARGAEIIAEIAGYSSAFDPDGGFTGFSKSGEGARYTMENACKDAGISTSDIDFISASANGTKSGDSMEENAIADIFGDIPVTVAKTRIGESYGAGSALNVACAVADIKNGKLTGSATSDSSKLNVIKETVQKKSSYAMVNAFSCDGNCASLIIKSV